MAREYNYYTKKLSEYFYNLKFEELPEAVIEQVKKITLHTLAAGFSSLPTEQSKRAIALTERKGGIAEATVWGGSGLKVPKEEAAFANGTMADIMDWEDCSWTGHPSAGAVPAALAVGEAEHISGKEYIEAVAAGFEGYQRIAMYEQPSAQSRRENKRMWGLVSWQVYAAAIPAAKILKLDLDQTMQTLGAAYYITIAPGLKHSCGTATSDIYHFAHGFSARNGVVAAEIAQLGFDNLYDALDDWNGAWNQVSDVADWTWLDRELGSKYYILELLLKHWPANVWNQAPVDLIQKMHRENGFQVSDIEKIRISPNVGTKMTGYHLTTRKILDAQFSIPYCICVYLLDPDPAHWFTEEMRNNEQLIELTKKVEGFGETVMTLDMFAQFQTGDFPQITIEVVLKDGTVLRDSLRYPKGHPKFPYTFREEIEHFRARCRGILPEDQTEAIIEKVSGLENVTDIASLAELTAAGTDGPKER